MKGYIFNTPFYTKTDWHSGKMILSRNGQTKGLGTPGSGKFNRRVTAMEAMHSVAGVRGTTSFRGKRIGRNAMALVDNAQMNQSFGGAEARAKDRERKLRSTEAKIAHYGPMVHGGSMLPMQQMADNRDFREYYE
jgi:hypothetical protein